MKRETGAQLLVVVLGIAIASVATSLDAQHRFIPERLILKISNLGGEGAGRAFEKFVRSFDGLRPVRVEVQPGVNLLLDPNDYLGRQVLISGSWQSDVWKSISDRLVPGAVYFDVGAHIGYDTLRGSVLVGQAGKVVAFEPNPNTLALLRDNVSASRAANVVVEPFACGDKDGTLTLYDSTNSGNSGASSLSMANADQQSVGSLPSFMVRVRRIDDVAKELGITRLDLMKVDVEGAEYMVLRGAEATLRRFHPKVVLEIIPKQLENMNTSKEEVFAFMANLGYGPGRQVDDEDWEWVAGPSASR
ncbi:MAG: FkbM family methyltransferase [Bryobacteraceae bacterium]